MRKPFGIVYKATNKIDGLCYIGATMKLLSERKKLHLAATVSGSTITFHNAIRRHGIDAFEWTVLAECASRKHLNETESALITGTESNTPSKGYNARVGGYRLKRMPAKRSFQRTTFEAPIEMATSIRAIAKSEGLSMGDIIRSLLRKGLAA